MLSGLCFQKLLSLLFFFLPISLAASFAVCQFNDGKSKCLRSCLEAVTGASASSRTLASVVHLDELRVCKSMEVSIAAAGRRRAHLAFMRSNLA